MTSYQVIQVMARADTVLFDFDGPICDIFSGLRNPYAADHLRSVLQQHEVLLPGSLQSTSDSFDILRAMPDIAPDFMEIVEEELAAVERAAVAVAEPTPHAADMIAALKTAGKTIGIVSNNSLSAVQLYVTRHHLSEHIDSVAARTEPDPSLLKPHPHLVDQVLDDLGADRARAALIGDQTSDIEAAHAAGISGIGFANKPGKLQRLLEVGAEAVIIDVRQACPLLMLQQTTRDPETPDELSR